MKHLLIAILCASACAAPQVAVTPAPSASPSATAFIQPSSVPTANASATLALNVQRLSDVPGHAIASPDGKWIAAPEPPPTVKTSYLPAVLLFDASGTRIAKIDAPGGAYSWRWLPDSSGMYIGLAAGQRAADLGIASLDGTVMKTSLQFADPLLTRDGKWIVAEHQAGCCAAVQQKEIWIAPRDGGAARVLAKTRTTNTSQPIALLGIDAKDRVVYRDGDAILRTSLTGEAVTTVARGAEFVKTIMGDTSPSGLSILVRGYEPARWYVLANDSVVPWNDAWGTVVERGAGMALLVGTMPIWVDAHSVLVTKATGLGARQLTDGKAWPYLGSLERDDVGLAFNGERVVVARAGRAVVIDLKTGRTGDTGIDLGTEPIATLASALPAGGFIVSTPRATYRID